MTGKYLVRKNFPVMSEMCATCPFRDNGWTCVRDLLQERALTEATPICHSTGKALTKRLGKSRLCRGARNFQLMIFYRIGFIEAPTDEAWQKKAHELEAKKSSRRAHALS